MADVRFEFTDAIRDLVEQAAINGNKLNVSDVDDYFYDMNMTKDHLSHIYAYLLASGIKIDGLLETDDILKEKIAFMDAAKDQLEAAAFNGIKDGARDRKEERAKSEAGDDTKIVKLFREELGAIKKLSPSEERRMIDNIVANEGDVALRNSYIERKLHDVVRIAEEYNVYGEYLEELIEEGNGGLTLAVMETEELKVAEDPVAFIESKIADAMQEYIDNELTSEDQGNAMAAKVNFISDAAKKWKEENGDSPSLEQLAGYTNLTVDELTDIINLASDKLKTDK